MPRGGLKTRKTDSPELPPAGMYFCREGIQTFEYFPSLFLKPSSSISSPFSRDFVIHFFDWFIRPGFDWDFKVNTFYSLNSFIVWWSKKTDFPFLSKYRIPYDRFFGGFLDDVSQAAIEVSRQVRFILHYFYCMIEQDNWLSFTLNSEQLIIDSAVHWNFKVHLFFFLSVLFLFR